MKRPNSTTLRRHAGFIKAGKIEKERKKIRKEFALMRTEQKKFYKVVVVVDDVKGQLGQEAVLWAPLHRAPTIGRRSCKHPVPYRGKPFTLETTNT
jgi:hypothetical protein